MTIQGERNGAGAQISTGDQVETGQAKVPDESRASVFIHGFWMWGTSTLFYMKSVNLYLGYYLRQTSAKALTMSEYKKKERYL